MSAKRTRLGLEALESRDTPNADILTLHYNVVDNKPADDGDPIINYRMLVGDSDGTSFGVTEVGMTPNVRINSLDKLPENLTGDFNGDGYDDLAQFDPYSGKWYIGLNQGGTFGAFRQWNFWYPKGWGYFGVADFNGDGKDDIYGIKSVGTIYVGLSTGVAIPTFLWSSGLPSDWQSDLARLDREPELHIGDFSGDGQNDLLHFDLATGALRVFVSTGTQFNETSWGVLDSAGGSPTDWKFLTVGDFNQDGKDDLGAIRYGTIQSNRLWVMVSDGTQFTRQDWGILPLPNGLPNRITFLVSGDFSGDGRDDVAVFIDNRWYFGTSTGTAFTFTHAGTWYIERPWLEPKVADFNSDGIDDILGVHKDDVNVWVGLSTGRWLPTTLWATFDRRIDVPLVGDFAAPKLP